jgi:PAS domain S-box-containing protein
MDSSQRELLLQAVFENAPIAIAVADAEGRFIEVNPAFVDRLGFSREEACRMTVSDITHPDDRPATLRLSEQVRNGQIHSYRQEKRYVARHGAHRWASVRVTALRDAGGAIRFWLKFLETITDRIQAEPERQRSAAEVQQSQKMETLGTLAGGMAHDFNNLLMAIQGNVSLLGLNKDPHQRDAVYLKNIETAVQRASELTSRILGFARGGPQGVRSIDLNRLLAQTAEIFGRSKKEITLRFDVQKDLAAALADPSQIEQVLLSLFANAGQAMPKGGELRLATRNVVIDPQDPQKPPEAAAGRYACIEIAETAVGGQAADPATGPGLSGAFGIIRSHRGFITVQSPAGRESIFRVFLPAAAEEAPRSVPAVRPVAVETARTILLVEDEDMVADIGRQMLERLGYRTLVARSGAEALALYQQRQAEIDLVILDMIMPGMGGAVVFDRLRSIHPQARVLLSSGYSPNGQAREILNRGCRGFIQKPFSIGQLEQKLNEVLSAA